MDPIHLSASTLTPNCRPTDLQVENFEVVLDRETKKFKGAVNVTYKKGADAARAVKGINGKYIDNRQVCVEGQEARRRISGGSR